MTTDKHLFSDSIYIGEMALAALLDAINTVYEGQYEDENGDPIPAEHHFAEMLIGLAATNELQFKLVTRHGGDVFDEYVFSDSEFHDYQGSIIDLKLAELINKLDGLVSVHATVVRHGANAASNQEGGDN